MKKIQGKNIVFKKVKYGLGLDLKWLPFTKLWIFGLLEEIPLYLFIIQN